MELLLKTNTNWSDEMDVIGYEIIKEKLYVWAENFLDTFFKKYEESSLEVYVGTNEYVSVSSDWKSHFSVQYLEEEQYSVLREVLGSSYGNPIFELLIENALEIMEEDEETFPEFEEVYKEYEKITEATK